MGLTVDLEDSVMLSRSFTQVRVESIMEVLDAKFRDELPADLVEQPQDIADLLTSYFSCTTRADWLKWKRDTVNAVIERAEVDPALSSYPGIEERTVCPLCGDGTDAFVARCAFAYRGGLERHLTGYGNMHQCTVLGTAFKLSAESLRKTLLASDRVETEREQERRKSEPMVRFAAQAPPAFLYEAEWRGSARGKAKMSDAEQRLRDLGFEIVIEDNVRTYRLVQDDWLVLADLRSANKIEFEVTSISKPKKKPQHWRTDVFYMLDSYALDILGKFRKRLQDAIDSFGDVAKQ